MTENRDNPQAVEGNLEVFFCDLCHASVPQADLDSRVAVRINDKILGRCCVVEVCGSAAMPTRGADPSDEGPDPVRQQVGEASLRLIAGVVPESTMSEVRGEIMGNPGAFPWRAVNDRLVADPVDEQALIEAGLRAQRDLILGGGGKQGVGRRKARRSLKVRSQSLVAYLLVRSIFFVLYTVAVVIALLLVKQNWPHLNIYTLLEWLQSALPGLFRTG